MEKILDNQFIPCASSNIPMLGNFFNFTKAQLNLSGTPLWQGLAVKHIVAQDTHLHIRL